MSTCRAVSNKKIATNQQGCGIFATQIIKIDDSKATQRADLKSVHLLVNHDEQHGTKKRTNFKITHNNKKRVMNQSQRISTARGQRCIAKAATNKQGRIHDPHLFQHILLPSQWTWLCVALCIKLGHHGVHSLNPALKSVRSPRIATSDEISRPLEDWLIPKFYAVVGMDKTVMFTSLVVVFIYGDSSTT